jgi:hypothetical protein
MTFVAVLLAIFSHFAFSLPTKSQLQFLEDYNKFYHAYVLVSDGFATAFNYFSFVYVWGLEDTVGVKFIEH